MTRPDVAHPPPYRKQGSSSLIFWLILLVAMVGLVIYTRDSADTTRVLFVGNSYTFYNDLPSMVAQLSDSAGTPMGASVIAHGGAWLSDHSRSPEVAAAITDGDFDIVVLQEQSMAPAAPDVARDSTYPAASALAQLAVTSGSEVVFFQTWAHRGGNVQVGHGSFQSMQDAISATYADLAIRYAGEVAPAGEAWRAHFLSGSTVPLHDSDGSHPNLSGSYLAAAVIAATIAEVEPADLDWNGPLDDGMARLLLQSAQVAVAASP